MWAELELLDADGQRITERTAVSLHTSAGGWDARDLPDLDPALPGVQTFVEGGHARLPLRAPATAANAELQVHASTPSGLLTAQARQRFAPALRPLVAAGLVEATVNLGHPKASPGRQAPDGFDAALAAASAGDGREKAGVRSSVFAKGTVGEDTLLTLGYESDKDRRERLFRDLQPDAFYPVYGDDALKAFDAQSTSRLYLRADRGTSSALYGDFTTQSAQPGRQLTAYQRSLTGARVVHGGEQLQVNAFAARESTRRLVIEQRGNGTSGPYDLGTASAVANSERVELIVRDRNQPALVLRSTPQQRFADYDFDPLTGRLLMRAPVPSLDAGLNPVSLRITVEVAQGGPSAWVAGADATWRATDALTVGGVLVRDWNPLEPFQLQGANAALRLGATTTVTAEAARTQQDGTTATGAGPGHGAAQRVELQHDGGAFKARAFAAHAERGFANPSASLAAGRTEAGVKAELRVDERTRVLAEGLHSADTTTARRRDGLLLGVERSAGAGVKLEAGVRHVAATPDSAPADAPRETVTTVRAKASAVLPMLPAATAFVEAEQDVNDAHKHLAAVGGDLQLPAGGRLYARHEFITSLSGPYGLDANQRRNATLLGIDMATAGAGRGFGEYRLREGASGREAEAAMGLRNQWAVAPGLRLNTSFERVQTLQGSGQPSLAATGAVEYTASETVKASARLEVRDAETERSLLASAAAAWKPSTDWTLLARGAQATNHGKNGQPQREQQRVQFGAAYRDGSTNRLNALGRYEFKRELGTVGTADGDRRRVHLLSVHSEAQPARQWTVGGEVAAKWTQETLDGLRLPSALRLLAARVTRDVAERWDVGANAAILAGAGTRQQALGAEVGWRAQTNLWLSLGYNLRGFKDRDFSSDRFTQRGAYVRLRFKFDERTLGRGDPA